jgi:hypothetical protein
METGDRCIYLRERERERERGLIGILTCLSRLLQNHLIYRNIIFKLIIEPRLILNSNSFHWERNCNVKHIFFILFFNPSSTLKKRCLNYLKLEKNNSKPNRFSTGSKS